MLLVDSFWYGLQLHKVVIWDWGTKKVTQDHNRKIQYLIYDICYFFWVKNLQTRIWYDTKSIIVLQFKNCFSIFWPFLAKILIQTPHNTQIILFINQYAPPKGIPSGHIQSQHDFDFQAIFNMFFWLIKPHCKACWLVCMLYSLTHALSPIMLLFMNIGSKLVHSSVSSFSNLFVMIFFLYFSCPKHQLKWCKLIHEICPDPSNLSLKLEWWFSITFTLMMFMSIKDVGRSTRTRRVFNHLSVAYSLDVLHYLYACDFW